jgi:hypothetical protein
MTRIAPGDQIMVRATVESVGKNSVYVTFDNEAGAVAAWVPKESVVAILMNVKSVGETWPLPK